MEHGPWLQSLGFETAALPPLDGVVHRIDRGKSGKSGWFIGWKEPFEFAIAGDWRTGERFELIEKSDRPLTQEERKRREIVMREAQQKALAERDERREAARLKADDMFRSGVNGGFVAHDYLLRKKIGLFGARVLDNEVLVPCSDADGNLWGLQKILVDGTKLFLSGQRVESTFHRIVGDEKKGVFVCEGYATGASIHMATGGMVYCAFSASNLIKIAELATCMHAGQQICIAGDDDRWSEGNAGRAAALKAGECSGARVVFPAFASEDGEPTDFNDLHCREGLEIVAEVLGMAEVVSGPDNVRSIVDEGKKKVGRPRGSRNASAVASSRPKMGDLYRRVAEVIMGIGDLPKFPVRYIAIEPETGTRVPAIVSDDESVQIVKAHALATDILQYCHDNLRGAFSFDARQARAAADVYLGLVEPMPREAIKIVSWRDEPGLTYRRLPWQRGDGLEPAPTWETLLGRMTNAAAYIEWVGSLFFIESAMQQYTYLFGLGGDGKGAINRFNAKVFGKAYRSKQPPARGDKFWSHGLVGARLVAFPDCEDAAFVRSGLFKSLTGGDPIDVEAKGEMSYTTELFAKYMIICNDRPTISSQKSDIRRIIFCEMSAVEQVDPEFENRLWAEGGAFLSACIRNYSENNPNHGPIKTDTADIIEVTEELEAPFHEFFNEHFRIDAATHVEPKRMLKLTQMQWKDRKSQLGFIRFLERQHGVRKRTLSNKQSGSGYIGMAEITHGFDPPKRDFGLD